MGEKRTGSCLCGAVRFELTGPLRPVIACHCRQCRKQSGHFWAATAVRSAYFNLTEDDQLKWYRSSDKAARGFCGTCGSLLFWKGDNLGYMAIAPGALDDDGAGLTLAGHIYCAFKGAYYDIAGGEFRLPEAGHGVTIPD